MDSKSENSVSDSGFSSWKKEHSKAKTAVSAIITLAVLAALIYLVFHDSYEEILDNIIKVGVWGLLSILLMGFLYQMMEAAALRALIQSKIPDFSLREAAEVVFLGVFGMTATFSMGSIPMQSYYLYRRGMVPGDSMGILVIRQVLRKVSLMICTTVIFLLAGGPIFRANRDLFWVIMAGYSICAVLVTGMVLICTWTRIQKLAQWFIDRLPEKGKWLKIKKSCTDNLNALYTGSKLLLHQKKYVGKSLLFNCIRMFIMYSIPFLCLFLLGDSSLSLVQTQVLTAMTSLMTSVLPSAAGMGPAEVSFMVIFSRYIGPAMVSSALILYRFSTYFAPFLLSVAVVHHAEKRLHQ